DVEKVSRQVLVGIDSKAQELRLCKQRCVHASRRRRCGRDLALPSLGLGEAAVQQRPRAAEQRGVPAEERLAQPVRETCEGLDLAVVRREVAELRVHDDEEAMAEKLEREV